MVTVGRLVAVLAIAVGIAAAQGTPTLTQHLKPGDTLRYLVRFEGNPVLSNLSLSFALPGSVKKDQAGFGRGFSLTQFKPLSTGGFEVEGVISKDVATGTYQLTQVYATHPPAARSYGGDELPKLTVDIINDVGYDFPPLKSVSPTP
jgi:hypothetical protein